MDRDLLTQERQDRFVAAAHDRPGRTRRMLVRCRAFAWSTSSWGETALQAASHLGHGDLLVSLVDAGVEPDVFAACAMGDRSLAARLIRFEDYDSHGVHGLPLLHFGVMSRDLSMVELLLDAGIAINPRRASLPPLQSAVATGFIPAIQLLLAEGADVRATDPFGATAEDLAAALYGRGSAIVSVLGRAKSALRLPDRRPDDRLAV